MTRADALPTPIPVPHGRKVLPARPRPVAPQPTVYELLARFWKHPLPNPRADAQPPLDGLPDAAERDRAEQAGWVAREFTLSLDAAVELIGRGVPFLVTLVEAGFSQPRLVRRGRRGPRDRVPRRRGRPPAGRGAGRQPGRAVRAVRPAVPGARPGREARQARRTCTLPDGPEREALYAVQKPLLTHDRAAAVAALAPDARAVPRPPARDVRRTRAGPVRRAPGQAARVLRRAARRAPARGDVGAVEGGRAARTEPDARAARAARSRGDRRSTPSRW